MPIAKPLRLSATAVALAGLAFSISARAQQTALQQGQLQLKLPALEQKASHVTDIQLDGALLRMGLTFIDRNKTDLSPDNRAVLDKLKGIYITSLHFDQPGQYTPADLEPLRTQLHGAGWSRIINVTGKRKDDTPAPDADQTVSGSKDGKIKTKLAGDEDVEIYVYIDGGSDALGFAVIAAEPTELNLINVVGPITLDDLAKLGGHLGIPGIEVKSKTGHE